MGCTVTIYFLSWCRPLLVAFLFHDLTSPLISFLLVPVIFFRLRSKPQQKGESTTDHILCPLHSLPRVQSAHPIDDHPLNTSDHLPVFAKLSANLPLPSSSPSSNQSTQCYPFSPRNRSKTPKEVVISKYTLPSGPRLSIKLSNSPTLSTLQSQPKSIDSLLSDVSSCLLSCSRHIPPRKFHPAKQPGWDSALKLASKTCKSYYRSWVRAGRPRNPDNPLRMAYKAAKKLFRSHLRLRNKRLDNIFFNSLDTNLDPRKFFQAVRNRSTSHNPQPATGLITVSGTSYFNQEVTEGWATYFENLGTPSPPSPDTCAPFPDINRMISTIPNPEPDWITPEEVSTVIQSLPYNKAAGPDHLSNEHLIFADETLSLVLTTIFNAILSTGHIPTIFQQGLIIPIPKGRNLDLTNPSYFRGITLLSCISKVLEKLLLHRLSSLTSKLHPLQGGFIPGRGPLHTAFILQESILSIQERKRKAFVGFLDVKKAFDTVWHEGLLFKLCQFGFPRYIWILIHNWYRGSSSAVLWNSKTSQYFPVKQGVRQGAILSPLLYSIFVNDLLHLLSSSGHGVSIGGIFCGSPMYADDLALIAESSAALQSMFDLVHNFSIQWHYQLNALKSAVLVFGESASSRSRYRPQRQWHIGSAVIQERDSYHHLGVLRSVSTSSISRTSERCSSCRSAFYSLNALGSRAGCLHPLTSLRLYKSYCLPILLYGCDLWSLTQTELTLLERTHRKILRTISGMPIRCKSLALQQSLGTISIRSLIHQRQLNFIHSFTSLPPDSLPSVIFVKRMAGPFSPRSSLTIFHSLVDTYKLPSIPSVLSNHLSRSQWKSPIKRCLLASEFSSYVTECAHLPLSDYPLSLLGKPYPHWLVNLGFPNISRKNISRMSSV